MQAIRTETGIATRPTTTGLTERPRLAVPEAGAPPLPAAAAPEQDGLAELDRAQCLCLLRSGVIGRVVYTVGALPAAHPVTYTLCGQEIIFRTGEGGLLRAAMLAQVLAFEVDHVDLDTRTGWSVLAIGKARRVTDTDRLTELATQLPPPWISGRAAHTIALPARLLTGRRLGTTGPVEP